MEPRICKERYNHSKKIKTLRILESNNFNYLKTSRQTKVTRPTLRKWEEKYGKEVFSVKSPTEQALVEIDAELKYNDINIIRNLYSIRKRTLQRIIVMAEKETKIEAMVNLLKFVSGEIQKFTEMEKPGYDPTIDFIAIVTNQLIQNRKEQSQLEDQE